MDDVDKSIREFRRNRTKRYLLGPEFRRDLFSSLAFFGVLALGIIGLQNADNDVIAVVYSLVTATAASLYVRKSYDSK
jgi:hypothetical protein